MKNFFGSALLVLTFLLFMPLIHTLHAYGLDNGTYHYPECPTWDHVSLSECAEIYERDSTFMRENTVRENDEIVFFPTLFSFFLSGLAWWTKVLAILVGVYITYRVMRTIFWKIFDRPDDDINANE